MIEDLRHETSNKQRTLSKIFQFQREFTNCFEALKLESKKFWMYITVRYLKRELYVFYEVSMSSNFNCKSNLGGIRTREHDGWKRTLWNTEENDFISAIENIPMLKQWNDTSERFIELCLCKLGTGFGNLGKQLKN